MSELTILPIENNEKDFKEYLKRIEYTYDLKGQMAYKLNTKDNVILSIKEKSFLFQDFIGAMCFLEGIKFNDYLKNSK